MMRCKWTFFICLLWLPRFVTGQDRVYRERLHVNTDQVTYLSGEWCWLSVYSLDAAQNRLQDFSKIAYVELLDANNNALVQGKIGLDSGRGQGALQLPADLPTGTYTLRAYTRWMRNFGSKAFFTKAVNVINTLHPNGNDNLRALPALPGAEDPRIICSVNKTLLGKRSPVDVKVHMQHGQSAALTLSVYRLDSSAAIGLTAPITDVASLPLIDSLMPELKGNIVTGRIVDKQTGHPEKQVLATLSIPGKRPYLYAVESGEDGRFMTEIVDYFGNNTLLMESNDNQYKVLLDNNFAPAGAVRENIPHDTLPESVLEAFSTRHMASQVQHAYHERDLARVSAVRLDSNYFFGKPDENILLDDYTRFTTMEEVFREVIKLVMVRKKDGQLHMHVWDLGHDVMSDEDALVLLDGVPVYDNKKLFAYDPLKIRKVTVKARRYAYGALGVLGVICLQTYSGDLKDYPLDPWITVTDYIGVQPPHPFYTPAYANDDAKASRLPDYRILLYWQPELTLNSGGDATAHFYTGDVKGHYLVVASGLDATGHPCYSTQTFEVL